MWECYRLINYIKRRKKYMSEYKNFIQDFPIRCGQILEDYEYRAKSTGREVTHILAIASAALNIPYERLRRTSGRLEHPSEDKYKYPRAVGKFDNTLDKEFLLSEMWMGGIESWKIGEILADDVNKSPEDWMIGATPLPDHLKVRNVLEHIRNALAHGSIFTLPNEIDEIQNIIFLSEEKDRRQSTGKYILLAVIPEDFTLFIKKWIKFMSTLNLLPI